MVCKMDDAGRLREAVEEAAARPEVVAAVGRVYAEQQAEIERRRPVCVVSGKCCRFEEYGHRLYVTTMELAFFKEGLGVRVQGSGRNENPGGCPFQVGKLCGVHAIRPFGCRMFFCDATSTEWQRGQYERFHGELKRLHGELGVPYFYVEWRAALGALGLVEGRVARGAEGL